MNTRLAILPDSPHGDAEHSHDHSHGSCSVGLNISVQTTNGAVAPQKFRGNAALVTLGCAKNQVDSEVMIGVLRNQGYEIVSDLTTAEVVIVNTCGFLQSAAKESVNAILEVAEYKKSARLRQLIVAGCLVERYRKDLQSSLPEVDAFLTLDDILKVGDLADGTLSADEASTFLDRAARPYFLYDETMPRQISTGRHTAYVKIAEGCNRPCTFCIIPKIRGAMRSRPIESVVREVQTLAKHGVREVNLVAQDLTSYGTDSKGETGKESLTALLHALQERTDVDWIRLLYSYPIGIDAPLLGAIQDLPRICNYLDLPLQHSSEAVLQRMKRPLGRYSPRKIVEFIRSTAPKIALRTTFIVGFPGETEADIDDLEQFISEGHFLNVGIFTYSREEGTPAHDLDQQVTNRVMEQRRKRLMIAQQKVVQARLREFVGTEVEILLEGAHPDTELLVQARTRFQAPEVDGIVMINDAHESLEAMQSELLTPGKLGRALITDVQGYDLLAKLVALQA